MSKYIAYAVILSALLGMIGCIQVRPLVLYDVQKQALEPQKPERVEQYVSSLLFADDTLNVWGIVEDSCKTFELTDVAYKGDAALKLEWNRYGCEWVGFGLGWENYAGKDLEPLLPHAAFEMYVRTEKGKAFGLPMVFTLEDYSSVMAFCYTANQYFERYYIDENWQKVTVPLAHFDDEGEGIDYTNIKQLQIEMQQSGKVLVDEIRLVLYEPQPTEPWIETPETPDGTSLPQMLFTDAARNDNGWGFMKDGCQDVQISTEEAYEGNSSIAASWSVSETQACSLMVFGISWTKWYPVDISTMKEEAELRFFLKAENPEALSFRIELEDFMRASSGVDWDPSLATPADNGWWEVRIPMKDLAGTAALIETQVKTLQFRMEGEGEMYIDNISWERTPRS
ncbi:MAG: hypothetical protein AAF399_14625 [Bacteroidota bacterium]